MNPQKGFYSLSFDGGASPTYLWHKYETVVAKNLTKSDFDATGTIGFNDLFTAFDYSLDVVKAGKNLYFSYSVNSRFCRILSAGAHGKRDDQRKGDAQRKVNGQNS